MKHSHWQVANDLTQLAMQTAQRTLALDAEIATKLLEMAADILGAEEAMQRLRVISKRPVPSTPQLP